MKATAPTLNHLDLATQELDQTKLKAYRYQVRYVNNQFISFIWGVFHALPLVDRQAIKHNQGDPLLDQHLETALKHTLKRFK